MYFNFFIHIKSILHIEVLAKLDKTKLRSTMYSEEIVTSQVAIEDFFNGTSVLKKHNWNGHIPQEGRIILDSAVQMA